MYKFILLLVAALLLFLLMDWVIDALVVLLMKLRDWAKSLIVALLALIGIAPDAMGEIARKLLHFPYGKYVWDLLKWLETVLTNILDFFSR